MRNIRIMIWGFGAMGSGIARMIAAKRGVEIVGVADMNPNLVGKDIYEIFDMDRAGRPEVKISGDAFEMITPGSCDLVILATDSFTEKAFPKIKHCVECGLNVISTAEEMSYPEAQQPELAKEIDRLAKTNGVSVFGTGINPGFVLDLLILALTGTCSNVESIEAARINDLSPFGTAVMIEQGVGLTPEEFNAKNDADDLAGHVGFPESIGLIAKGLGLEIDKVTQTKDPIVSEVERRTQYAEVKPGNVAGIRQQSYGILKDGKELIHLDHPQQILPHLEGVETGDYVTVHTGDYDVNLAIKPEIPGGVGTIAMVVNSIPHVINADKGLVHLLDMPVPRAIMGDMRDQLNPDLPQFKSHKKGDYVVIHRTVLPAGERAAGVPEDTANKPLDMWLKGFLQEDAEIGDTVKVKTLIDREVEGELTAKTAAPTHTYGEVVPELMKIHHQVKQMVRDAE